MSGSPTTIRLGTRGSALALAQTRQVADALAALPQPIATEIRVLTTIGDRDKQTPLSQLGGQGIFAKELETALLADEIDLAVHSSKDLTSKLPDGLVLAATLPRADARDVLVARDRRALADLPAGARVGTSSRRRMMQLRVARPDLEAVELRGNLDTRLRKVAEGQVDAAILAAAGLLRMGWHDRVAEYLSVERFVPSPGQGAIGLECRADDERALRLAQAINHSPTYIAVMVERAWLAEIGGGCRSPLGGYATLSGDTVALWAMLADEQLTEAIYRTGEAPIADAPAMARELARELKGLVDQREADAAS